MTNDIPETPKTHSALDASTLDKAAGKIREAGEKARSLAVTARERTEEATAGARDTAYRAADKANNLLTEHPLAATAAAAAAGMAIGLLLPRWRRKASVAAGTGMVKTLDRLMKTVAAAGTARSLFATMSSAADAVKSGARQIVDHTPDAETVKDGALRALAKAGETAQSAGRQVVKTAQKVKTKTGAD